MKKHSIEMNVVGNSYKSYVVSVSSSHDEIKDGFVFDGVSLKKGKSETYYIKSTKTLVVNWESDNLVVIPKEDMEAVEGLIQLFNDTNGGFPTETEIDRFVREHYIRKDSNFVKYTKELDIETLEELFDHIVEVDRSELSFKALKTLFTYYTPALHCKEAYIALAKSQSWDGLKSLGNPFSE